MCWHSDRDTEVQAVIFWDHLSSHYSNATQYTSQNTSSTFYVLSTVLKHLTYALESPNNLSVLGPTLILSLQVKLMGDLSLVTQLVSKLYNQDSNLGQLTLEIASNPLSYCLPSYKAAVISHCVPRGELVQWMEGSVVDSVPEMKLTCTHARTNTHPCLCKHVATISVIPKCSHMYTALPLSQPRHRSMHRLFAQKEWKADLTPSLSLRFTWAGPQLF